MLGEGAAGVEAGVGRIIAGRFKTLLSRGEGGEEGWREKGGGDFRCGLPLEGGGNVHLALGRVKLGRFLKSKGWGGGEPEGGAGQCPVRPNGESR